MKLLADNNAANFVTSVLPPLLDEYSLKQNFLNPFNPKTIINYQLPMNNFVSLKVYDVSGKEVMSLVDQMKMQDAIPLVLTEAVFLPERIITSWLQGLIMK